MNRNSNRLAKNTAALWGMVAAGLLAAIVVTALDAAPDTVTVTNLPAIVGAPATATASAPASRTATRPATQAGADADQPEAPPNLPNLPVARPGVIVGGVIRIAPGGGLTVIQGGGPDTAEPEAAPGPMPATYPAVSADEVRKLAAKLDSDDFKDREAAQKSLVDMGPGIVPVLREMLKNEKLSMEVTTRIDRAIKAVLPATQPAKPPTGRMRRGIAAPAMDNGD